MERIDFDASGARVTGYLHEDHDRLEAHKIRPALLVCPGGAYAFTSPREADPAALPFFTMGYQTFILRYSCGKDAAGYLPLRQLAETVRAIRVQSGDWHINPGRVAVMGFSAGGHLAASLGILWWENALFPDFPGTPEQRRPDALVLCYPVITMGEKTNPPTAANVSGGDGMIRKQLSLENHVTVRMPPTFVWHTVDDESVPVENTLLLIQAMQHCRVPYECHLFAHGSHGSSMCNQEVERINPAAAAWVPLCKTWLNNQFSFTP